ncbi:E3 ubiquitin-protein ligase UPL1-like [Selaginella moellendorffii]|uniref:E3 ubiquitin-protein ligase UPL1-like n=1 Tax=Selaginella moellendorffii TaxID=88036 RepID=UPI000D1CBB14|nr:E3 ubiquitin-protein ligase UPL1-like [Selaginella moellendorffii]|eukprot:XP_024530587.1 E3 ubiquitin-protein ligase UPL1-like [Selaginella moellendorffii]
MAIHDLIPGGRDVPVTEENKHNYVNHVADYRLTGSIKPQIDAFLDGFYELISKDLISIFDVKELELLISGPPDVDGMFLLLVKPLSECDFVCLQLKSCKKLQDVNILIVFHDWVFQGMTKDLILFYKLLFHQISNTGLLITEGGEWNQLPTAYTCSGTIVLPHYQSREQLEEKLLLAIREGCEGFGFV